MTDLHVQTVETHQPKHCFPLFYSSSAAGLVQSGSGIRHGRVLCQKRCPGVPQASVLPERLVGQGWERSHDRPHPASLQLCFLCLARTREQVGYILAITALVSNHVDQVTFWPSVWLWLVYRLANGCKFLRKRYRGYTFKIIQSKLSLNVQVKLRLVLVICLFSKSFIHPFI